MELFAVFQSESSYENLIAYPNVQRCPFLRNINLATSFSFASTGNYSMPIPGAKGPIFEDGPNFNLAFKFFHGQDGVVPLSEEKYVHEENSVPKPALQFNPLAAKAATISLSTLGGYFGFSHFSNKWKENKNSFKKRSSQNGNGSTHEVLGDEWLQTGQCPIAKSYRAVNSVLPLVAKVLQPPTGVKLKCPPAVVAARAALARTALVKTLRPQPLPAKMLAIALLGMAVNVPLGVWREHTAKFSPQWFVAVHAAVPFIAMLRKSVVMPKTAMAITLAASIIGQIIGSRSERIRLKAKLALSASTTLASTSQLLDEAPISLKTSWQCSQEEVKASAASGSSSVTTPTASVCF